MKIIEMIRNLISPPPTWTLVYAPEKSETGAKHQIYSIENPHKGEILYCKGERVGIIVKTYNRNGNFRSFRADRIICLAKD